MANRHGTGGQNAAKCNRKQGTHEYFFQKFHPFLVSFQEFFIRIIAGLCQGVLVSL